MTPTANPLTSGSDGTFGFYVADGRYDLKISGLGITTRTFADVEIFDATEKNAGDGTLTANVANFKNLENIRFADQFASISAAITDLGAGGGIVFIPAGTYLDNIVLTSSNVTLQGAGIGVTIIKPSNTSNPVLTIDGTSVATIDGITICDLSIYPVTATACDSGVTIKGKIASNQPNDHHRFMRVEIGGNALTASNTTGTNNFRVGMEITSGTIWTSLDRVFIRGTRGDGLKANITVATARPLNAFYVTNSEFIGNYGYGVNLSIAGAVTPGAANHFLNCDIESNCNNTALSPAAGFLINGVWQMQISNLYCENNCPSSADANAAHIRITGSLVSPQLIGINGMIAIMTASAAKYCIYNDAARTSGTYDNIRLFGSATAAIHVSSTSNESHIIIGNGVTLGKIDSISDASGVTHVTAPAMNLFARKLSGSGEYPIVSNTFDLVTTGGSVDYPNSNFGIIGPVTVNTITSGVKGQYLWLDADSGGAVTLTQNSGGAGSFKFNDSTTRVLQIGDAVLMRHDGTNWLEVNLGAALLGKSNTWTQSQAFNGLFTKYNGLSTVSGGVPSELATVDLTGQTAAIGTTTLLTAPVAGQYRLSWNAKVTTAAGTSSTLGPLTITYTDPDGVAITFAPAFAINGSTPSITGQTTNNTQTIEIGLPLTLNVKSGTVITYSFAYASNAANAMAYNLHMKLELM